MTNHYHLVVETADANLARGMRQLNGVYTQRFNHAHRCVGHVYQGRYAAVLVQREQHLLALLRYVMLNPVPSKCFPSAILCSPGPAIWTASEAPIHTRSAAALAAAHDAMEVSRSGQRSTSEDTLDLQHGGGMFSESG